jgi:glycosyltransferase involved in cell wall biosynthesis
VISGQTILVISPQAWGKMFISKHHYAIELAAQGNLVYFLNPPEESKENDSIRVLPSELNENLFLIRHDLYFPYYLKFHAPSIFHFLMKRHVKKILRKVGRKIDIVWSFDLGTIYPFRLFPESCYKIFHPVDEPVTLQSIKAAEGADIIFSVTWEILKKYGDSNVPKYFINHGLSDEFLTINNNHIEKSGKISVGFSGNLLRSDLDMKTITRIASENQEIEFEFWGSYRNDQSNIGSSEQSDQVSFIKELKNLGNVILHGPVPVNVLAKEYARMDAFLICYDIEKDQSKGTNYHKVMEFLSTGKVVISNNITTYQKLGGLIEMIPDRESNARLPELFKKVINNLEVYNANQLVQKRITFAKDNTYRKQLERISSVIAIETEKN